MAQSKGSASQILFDFESSYKTLRSGSARKPINVFFNSCDVTGTRTQNQAQTIRGNRNAVAPFQGNMNVAGNLVVPLDINTIGYFLKAAIGTPQAPVELPVAAPTGSDIKVGTPTISISSGSYTFSTNQAAAAVGDRIIWTDGTSYFVGYITVDTDPTTGTIKTTRGGASNPADISNATIVSIMDNKSDVSTITISSGVATLSAAPLVAAAVGDMIIYDSASNKYAFITQINSTTEFVVKDGQGFTAPNGTTLSVEFLGKPSKFKHVFKISPTADLPSFMLERAFTDMSPIEYVRHIGCKINTFSLSLGGDGELLVTMNILGADETGGPNGTFEEYTDGSNPAAVTLFQDRYQQFDAIAYEGGVSVQILRTMNITLSNNLDVSNFVIGGGGIRRSLPEGIAGVSGNIEACFEDASILDKARNNTESSLQAVFTVGNDTLLFKIPELKYQRSSPAITGPLGIVLGLDFQGYYANSDEASAMYVELTNGYQAY